MNGTPKTPFTLRTPPRYGRRAVWSLIAALGLWLGIRPLLSIIMYGFLAGGAAALFLLVTKQKKRQDYFAYGPYFALSGIAVLLSWIRPLF